MARITGLLWTLLFLFNLGCVGPVLTIGELPREVNCIVVAPFDVRYDANSTDEMLSEFLALDLYRLGAHGVLGPQDLSQLFVKARDPLPPSIDQYWARVLGKRLAVDGVVFGSISRLPLYRNPKTNMEQIQLVLDVYLLQVRSGEIRWAYGAREVVDTEGLVPAMNRYSELMASSLVAKEKGIFGERNCWQAPKRAVKKKVVRVKRGPTLTAAQQKTLNRIMKVPGLFLNGLIFDGRTEQLTKDAVPVLRRVAAVLKSSKSPRKTLVVAHIDATGNAAEDLRVTRKRALAIKNYLIGMGVPAKRLQVAGYGGTQPKVPNLNERSRLQNRGTIVISIDPRAKK